MKYWNTKFRLEVKINNSVDGLHPLAELISRKFIAISVLDKIWNIAIVSLDL